jgi:hypothetical protein
LVLVPLEFLGFGKWGILLSLFIVLLGLPAGEAFWHTAGRDLIFLWTAIVAGTVGAPLLLPVIPGRSFAWKGWLLGSGAIIAVTLFYPLSLGEILTGVLIFGAVSAFLMLGFTGSSTYTSLSGVVKDMQYAMVILVPGMVLGLIIRLVLNPGSGR